MSLTFRKALEFKPSFLVEGADACESAWLGHIPFLYWLIGTLKPNNYVELGVHNGASFFSAIEAAMEAKSSLNAHALDAWEGDEHAGFYGGTVYENFCAYLDKKSYPDVQIHKAYFNETLSKFEDESIDVLHVDGLHTYEAVRDDYDTWAPKVRPGGVILFHDIAEVKEGFGVWQLWDEIKAQTTQTYEFDHSHGLGVLIKPASPGTNDLLEEIRRLDEAEGFRSALINRGNLLVKKGKLEVRKQRGGLKSLLAKVRLMTLSL